MQSAYLARPELFSVDSKRLGRFVALVLGNPIFKITILDSRRQTEELVFIQPRPEDDKLIQGFAKRIFRKNPAPVQIQVKYHDGQAKEGEY